MESGILILNKEANMTSREVVNIACKKLNTRHIGHTGTLDPIATGVLVLGVNDGCKIIDLLTSSNKAYEAEIIVGMETDTLDITGNIIHTYNIEELSQNEVEKAIQHFQGKYLQEVPKYSAIHVNGKRLHEYARKNETVELPKREVEIKEIKLLTQPYKKDGYFHFSIFAHVSKGTYIRSLIRDIGTELKRPCTMKNLKRVQQGIFDIKDAITVDAISVNQLISIGDALKNYDKIIVDDTTKQKVLNGRILDFETTTDYLLVYSEKKELLAIYQPYYKNLKKMKPYRVFKR